ncbi:hypothetical protein CERZMDRAFT_84692 [Cercospora zeae-maydis SCOH1-5]|uniref:Uncharacterized protein n=1 Tax=Cercospora zeae-maydis SCOH1-5 TaxID=717836 RepID=A0A6A6FG07_9PEZI|nr:hypothetical protein CERZMDRAFT_84692 [Cercospora zeae-maydis SCOH1-5]
MAVVVVSFTAFTGSAVPENTTARGREGKGREGKFLVPRDMRASRVPRSVPTPHVHDGVRGRSAFVVVSSNAARNAVDLDVAAARVELPSVRTCSVTYNRSDGSACIRSTEGGACRCERPKCELYQPSHPSGKEIISFRLTSSTDVRRFGRRPLQSAVRAMSTEHSVDDCILEMKVSARSIVITTAVLGAWHSAAITTSWPTAVIDHETLTRALGMQSGSMNLLTERWLGRPSAGEHTKNRVEASPVSGHEGLADRGQ